MATSNLPGLRLAQHRGLLALLVVPAVAVLYFLQHSALPYYAAFDPATYGEFWPRRWGLVVHVAGGLTAACTGLVQLWLGLTGRTGAPHRALGRTYVAGVLVGSVAAYYLALTINPQYVAYAAGLFMLSTAWVVTTAMAVASIRRRALEQHREWMIRSYTVTFAFVTFRLVEKWLRAWLAPDDGSPAVDSLDVIMAWACWSVPLLVCEPLLQLRKLRRR